MATNYNKTWQKITHFAIRTRVEDALLVGTLLLHPVLPHSLLPTLAARNEKEVRPQSLRDPMWGRGPGSSRHLQLSILIFINYYKFLILWTMKLNELYTKKSYISLFLNHDLPQNGRNRFLGQNKCVKGVDYWIGSSPSLGGKIKVDEQRKSVLL